MKIAIVSPYISTLGNLEYYQSQQLNLASELTKLGLNVDIITAARNSGDTSKDRVGKDIMIYRLPVIARWTDNVFNQLIMVGLWKQLNKGQYDFIQSSDDCIYSTFMSALFALHKRSRLIIYQGIYEYSNKKMIRAFMKLYDLTAGMILKRVCCIAICKTKKSRQFLQRKGFKRTLVIPVGVNTELFYPEERAESNCLELLSVGNLIPLKNYPLILEVLEKIVKKGVDVRLTVIGSGPEKDKILSFVKDKKLLDHFRLLENVPNRNMRQYYSQSDLLLLLSKTEIFGMVVLEAMACGCPVMGSPTPGVLDVISDGSTGFVVDNIEPDEIAHRILSLFSNENDLDQMRKNISQLIKEKYSWKMIASQYERLYSEEALAVR